MSRAAGTHTCRPAALGEAIEVVRPVARLYSIADHRHHFQGRIFLVGFSPTLPTRTGARVCRIDIFYPLHVASGKPKKKEFYLLNKTLEVQVIDS
ncbi:hypothetical protein EVAR_84232_1 [Eumeta japonica]|uniref:Uncharacterized protein n=1 Tax=Eumeta variegata TaxID=151549 RepID=A0A4C1WU74_EUMVA|nr:hypothetical protein EVAR_84232_1 [Eumeta japonica]